MAVNTHSDTENGGTGFAPGEVGVDTRFTPIYRFLRLAVRGVNRLFFRTTDRKSVV